ncbi:MAG: RnfABCDGE type electron transport complex subunit D [Bacilli bacterium]|nr:RnfABCDGE type electron transport complex subunit D [Bacilli bacterium]MDD4406824.1 RnfABCDGE type electron transport complex subunit D [Bacilli bacterium]
MNNIYLRSDYSIKKISKYIILSLIPLILAGFYKNGIKLYANDLVNIYGLFKPLLITISGFLTGIIVNLIYENLIKKNKDKLSNKIFSSFHPIYGIIVGSIISINTNIFLYIIVTFIIFMISKFIKNTKINLMAFTSLIIIFIMNIISSFTFLNIYEATKTFNLSSFDYLIGRGSGGINTTFGLLLLISLVILGSKNYYKKMIPLFSALTFMILICGYGIYKNEIELIFNNIFSNGILFCFIYIATDPISSSYTMYGNLIYSLLLGILTFIFFLIEPTLAVLGAILIVSILHDFIDKLCLR